MYIVRVPHDRTSMYIHTHTTHTHARTDATQRRHTPHHHNHIFSPNFHTSTPHTHVAQTQTQALCRSTREKTRRRDTTHTHHTHTTVTPPPQPHLFPQLPHPTRRSDSDNHEPRRRGNQAPNRPGGRRRPCREYSRSGRSKAHHPPTAAPLAHQRLEPHPPGAPTAAAGPAALRVQEVPLGAETYLALVGASSRASRGGQEVGSR